MPTTLRNTDILFDDNSTQNTAYPGIPAQGAIGSIQLLACSKSTPFNPGTTIGGAQLYSVSNLGSIVNAKSYTTQLTPHYALATLDKTGTFTGHIDAQAAAWAATFNAQAGTWRLIGVYSGRAKDPDGYDVFSTWPVSLYVRVA